ncbi:MAG TPA: hypothetical protein VGI87_05775 [Solirubrobacteraceae bacterium]
MDQISRPMMALLVATLAIAGLWFTLLKPKPSGASGSSSSSSSPSALQSDVTKAHQAVTTANRAGAAQGGGGAASAQTHTLASAPAHLPPTTSTTTSTTATTPATTKPATTSTTKAVAKAWNQVGVKVANASHATQKRADTVVSALNRHKVVAALFYNPAATDDQAVKHELASISTHGGRVVKLTVPIAELTRYPVITQQVPVTESPTLVLIDRQGQATMLVGFADGFSISQRLNAVLAAK